MTVRLINVLCLNKIIFRFGKIESLLCSSCTLKDETPYHLFYEFCHKKFWNQLRNFLSKSLDIPPFSPQSATVGLINQKENVLILDHLLLIFKFFSSGKLNIEYLKTIITKLETSS